MLKSIQEENTAATNMASAKKPGKRLSKLVGYIEVHSISDYGMFKSGLASSGIVTYLAKPKKLGDIDARMAACKEHKALYALAALHLLKSLPLKVRKAKNYEVTIYMPQCGFEERIEQARQSIAYGGFKADGDAADAISKWELLIDLLDQGLLRFYYVEKDDAESHAGILDFLKLAAKDVAQRSQSSKFAQHMDLGTLYEEWDTVPPVNEIKHTWKKKSESSGSTPSVS